MKNNPFTAAREYFKAILQEPEKEKEKNYLLFSRRSAGRSTHRHKAYDAANTKCVVKMKDEFLYCIRESKRYRY